MASSGEPGADAVSVPEFNVGVARRGADISLTLEGDLDLASASLLAHALQQAEATDAASITIDLAAVAFIDSTGLRALLEADVRNGPQSGRLQIINATAQGRRLFQLAGVLDRRPFNAPPGSGTPPISGAADPAPAEPA
ncbi:MAG TPA: STAS domain-containing protein [Solirubrobacteraceae bacterium]